MRGGLCTGGEAGGGLCTSGEAGGAHPRGELYNESLPLCLWSCTLGVVLGRP